MYLDEQPITTIQGNLDIHMYDMARVEALSGPQGTLYGASSQAGTIRLITNKPDLEAFSAGYGVEGNMVDGDDTGYVAEGFVNIPLYRHITINLWLLGLYYNFSILGGYDQGYTRLGRNNKTRTL